MQMVYDIALIWYKFYRIFWWVAYYISDIPLVGNDLHDYFLDIAWWFYETDDEGEPLPDCLYSKTVLLGDSLSDILTKVTTFSTWADAVALVLAWAASIPNIVTWFGEWITNTRGVIDTWWGDTLLTVEGLIATALETAEGLIDTVSKSLATLQKSWDDFKSCLPGILDVLTWFASVKANVLSIVDTWWDDRLKDIDTLIDSTLKTWFPFYDSLALIWVDIASFFTNPLDFLWDRFADWFLGPEG